MRLLVADYGGFGELHGNGESAEPVIVNPVRMGRDYYFFAKPPGGFWPGAGGPPPDVLVYHASGSKDPELADRGMLEVHVMEPGDFPDGLLRAYDEQVGRGACSPRDGGGFPLLDEGGNAGSGA
jgi:hypothetical protein